MSGDVSGSQTPADNQSVATATTTVKKKFQNGWTKELETMIADWADKAACYRWMHEETSRRFSGRDRSITLPVIILSTLTGTANFALDGFFDPASDNKKYAQSAIGGLSILAGIISTIGTKLAYATSAEAHRVAAVSWGKFNRNLCIEMNLNPDERIDSISYLKMFRIELDRLIDQSPTIPKPVIEEFNRIFKNATNVVKPEITGILNHTKVFDDKGARLKRLAAEATIALHYKKGVLKQMVMDSLEEKTRAAAIESARQVATEIIEKERETVRAAAAAALAAQNAALAEKAAAKKAIAPKPLVERQKLEREAELKKIATAKAGTVAALKERFRRPSVSFAGVPPDSSSPIPGAIAIPIQEVAENITVQIDEKPQEVLVEDAKPVDVVITVEDTPSQEEAKPSIEVENEQENTEEGKDVEEEKTEEPPRKGWLGIF